MSMRDYAVEDYGMIIDEEAAKEICHRMFDDFDDEGEDLWYALYETELCEYIGEFTGEAFRINDDGKPDWTGDSYDFEALCYLPLSVYPSLFRGAYGNMGDIIEELKDKIGKYLPDDFDYRSRIRHIVGTYCG